MKVPTPREKTIIRTAIETIYAESIKNLEEKIKKQFGRDLSEVKYKKQEGVKTGKNQPCLCDSGKLYKRCCIDKKTGFHYLVYVNEEILDEKLELEQQQREDSLQHEKDFKEQANRLKKTVGPQDLTERQIRDDCPICGRLAYFWTKSVWKDRLCENKHVWHTCNVHGVVVIGPPDYNRDPDLCSCNKD